MEKYLNVPETSWLLLRILWSFSITYKSVIETSIKVRRTAQLLVMCNRSAVHTQLLINMASRLPGLELLRIATTSSAAGATARIAVVVQTGCRGRWGPARCNDRRQRGLLWTSHCRAHQGHPAYVHCLPH